MRIRPGLTIEDVFSLHEKIERDHPPGSERRGAVLEQVHQVYLHYVALVRQLRQMPHDRDFAKLKLLADMVLLDAHTMEQMSFRALAKEVLGRKATTGGVERLARKYSKRLRDCPRLDQRADGRFDGLAREILREYAGRTALKDALVLARERVTKG